MADKAGSGMGARPAAIRGDSNSVHSVMCVYACVYMHVCICMCVYPLQ